jgi:hypothetical protein
MVSAVAAFNKAASVLPVTTSTIDIDYHGTVGPQNSGFIGIWIAVRVLQYSIHDLPW